MAGKNAPRGIDGLRQNSVQRGQGLVQFDAPSKRVSPESAAPTKKPNPTRKTQTKPDTSRRTPARRDAKNDPPVRTTLLIYNDTAERLDELIWDEFDITGEKPRKITIVESAITNHMPTKEVAQADGGPREEEIVKLTTEISMSARMAMTGARKVRSLNNEVIPVAWFYSEALDRCIADRRRGLGL